jgi:hypothetical protein
MASKRKVLTLEDRVAALKQLDGGKSLREVSAQYGCGKSQIQRIKIDREKIMKEWEAGTS